MFDNTTAGITKQRLFGDREVGLTHPDLPSYIRLADNGDIQIMVNGEVGIIISQIHGSIMFVADVIKFVSKENGGLRWNQLNFNKDATTYNEPTFVYSKEEYDMYTGLDDYLDW